MQVFTSAFTRQKENLRQAVAIGRATALDTKVIIMDEPTAAWNVAAISKALAAPSL